MQPETRKLYTILNDCQDAGKRLQLRSASLIQRARRAEKRLEHDKAQVFRNRAIDQIHAYKMLKTVMIYARDAKPVMTKDLEGLERVIALVSDTQGRLTDWAQESFVPSEVRQRAIQRSKQDIRAILDLIEFIGGKPHPRQGVSEDVPELAHEGPGEVHTGKDVTEQVQPVLATPEAFGITLEPLEPEEEVLWSPDDEEGDEHP